MKLHVAYDHEGRIVGAAEADPKGAGDKPAARPGITVAELELPKELAGAKPTEHLHRLRVDVRARKLIMRG
jgi:hypothetical protein